MLRSVDFEDVIKDFALTVKEKDFLNCALHCTSMQQECKRDLSL